MYNDILEYLEKTRERIEKVLHKLFTEKCNEEELAEIEKEIQKEKEELKRLRIKEETKKLQEEIEFLKSQKKRQGESKDV